jgi:hypothetical protein
MNKAVLLPIFATTFMLGGCETVSGFFEDSPTEPPPVVALPRGPADIELLSQLIAQDAEGRAIIVKAEQDAWLALPSPQNQLRYALVLAIPGHLHTDQLEAQRLFSQLLANPEGLDQDELHIARVFMAYAQHWQQLQAKYDELAAELDQVQAEGRSERDRQLNQMRAQVNALSEQLREAEQKLDAIANIEKQMERPEPKRN